MMLLEIGKLIKEHKKFALICHTSPDGDSLGSMLGLYNFLTEYGKNADVYVEDKIAEKYCFLPGITEINNIDTLSNTYDVLFALDNGDVERFGSCKKLLECSNIVINMDHHLTNGMYGNINYVDTAASSVGEIVYQLLKQNGFSVSMNTAACLYTSIISDTGGFKYSNTTSATMTIAGELLDTGINISEINNNVFDVKTVPQVKLISHVTSTLNTYYEGKVAAIYLSKEMLRLSEAGEEDAGDFVNYARDIIGVEVGLFIKEKSDHISRVSLRSKNYVDVRKIAEKFGGGGHLRASGCTIEGNVEKALSLILNELNNVLDVK